MVNSTGRLAGTPVVLSPGPLAFTLLASCVGSTLTLKGLWDQGVMNHQKSFSTQPAPSMHSEPCFLPPWNLFFPI